MRALIIVIRLAGILIALAFIASDIMDILGLVPYSEATPPLRSRVLHSLPTFGAAIILLLPFRYMVRGKRFAFVAAVLAILLLVTTVLAVSGAAGFIGGKKSWHIVPAGLMFMSIPASHIWVLLRLRQRSGLAA